MSSELVSRKAFPESYGAVGNGSLAFMSAGPFFIPGRHVSVYEYAYKKTNQRWTGLTLDARLFKMKQGWCTTLTGMPYNN